MVSCQHLAQFLTKQSMTQQKPCTCVGLCNLAVHGPWATSFVLFLGQHWTRGWGVGEQDTGSTGCDGLGEHCQRICCRKHCMVNTLLTMSPLVLKEDLAQCSSSIPASLCGNDRVVHILFEKVGCNQVG